MRHRRSPLPAPPPRFLPLLWPAIVLLALSTGVDVAWGDRDTELVEDEAGTADKAPALNWRKRLEQGVRAMSVGSLQDRLDATYEAEDLLDPDDSDERDAPESPTQAEIGAALVSFLDSEPDEWVVWNLLDSLEFDTEPAVHDLFRAALASSSSNLRAKALTFYTVDTEDRDAVPLLEGLWETGVPSWALPDLMAALAAQGSTLHLEEFMEKTQAPDLRTRIAAIEALSELRNSRALPGLLELARTADSSTRRAAIDSLAKWLDQDEVIATLEQALSSDPEWRGHALDALLKADTPVRDATILRVLSDPEARDLWARAAEGFVVSDNPEANAALVGALAAAEAANDPETVHRLIAVLHNRDDVDALPLLLRLDPGMGGGTGFFSIHLLGYLERDRASRPTYQLSTSPFVPLQEQEADPHHVVAGGKARSVRCWPGPQIGFESWLRRRIPDGTVVSIDRFFDRDGETWGELDGPGAGGCWVPLNQIEAGFGPGVVPPDPRRREVDLPAGVLRTSTGRALLKEGRIELLDESDEAAGIAVNIRVPGPSLQEILKTLSTAARFGLDDQMDDVFEWLDEERRDGAP